MQDFSALFAMVEERLSHGAMIMAIDGGSAAGKTTLAALLQERYDAAVFHTDDFFLQPHQRTAARYAEVGGNMDRERFLQEVLQPLSRGEAVCYRPFDCHSMTFKDTVCVSPQKLTVIEGAYAMHADLMPYYDVTVFLDVSPALQKARIQTRNTPAMAEQFFTRWIPLEQAYFAATDIQKRCDLCVAITQK